MRPKLITLCLYPLETKLSSGALRIPLYPTIKKARKMRAFFMVPPQAYFFTSSSSTSNTSVALGGMRPPAPFSP